MSRIPRLAKYFGKTISINSKRYLYGINNGLYLPWTQYNRLDLQECPARNTTTASGLHRVTVRPSCPAGPWMMSNGRSASDAAKDFIKVLLEIRMKIEFNSSRLRVRRGRGGAAATTAQEGCVRVGIFCQHLYTHRVSLSEIAGSQQQPRRMETKEKRPEHGSLKKRKEKNLLRNQPVSHGIKTTGYNAIHRIRVYVYLWLMQTSRWKTVKRPPKNRVGNA